MPVPLAIGESGSTIADLSHSARRAPFIRFKASAEHCSLGHNVDPDRPQEAQDTSGVHWQVRRVTHTPEEAPKPQKIKQTDTPHKTNASKIKSYRHPPRPPSGPPHQSNRHPHTDRSNTTRPSQRCCSAATRPPLIHHKIHHTHNQASCFAPHLWKHHPIRDADRDCIKQRRTGCG